MASEVGIKAALPVVPAAASSVGVDPASPDVVSAVPDSATFADSAWASRDVSASPLLPSVDEPVEVLELVPGADASAGAVESPKVSLPDCVVV